MDGNRTAVMVLAPLGKGLRLGTLLRLHLWLGSLLLGFAWQAAAAEPARFERTFESPEALAAEVLRALQAEDLDRLRALPLSRKEFEDWVWPELPVSRPERNVPIDYVWGQLEQRSRGALQTMFSANRGRRYTVVRVVYEGETTEYESFAVHRKARVVALEESGRTRRLALFGSVLEHQGRFKLFSFVSR